MVSNLILHHFEASWLQSSCGDPRSRHTQGYASLHRSREAVDTEIPRGLGRLILEVQLARTPVEGRRKQTLI